MSRQIFAQLLRERAKALGLKGWKKIDVDLVAKYSEDQPRDGHGRWTSGGGGESKVEYTAAEHAAVVDYTTFGFVDINSYLRSGMTPDAESKQTIKGLDSAISKSVLSSDTTLYRGVEKDGVSMLGGLRVGSTITDKGFVSTTSNAKLAAEFQGHGGIAMRIAVSAGSRGLDVVQFGHLAQERETILPRGSQFEVTGFNRSSRILDVKLRR